MSAFRIWLGDLGERSSRTDVWVVLYVLTYFSCFTGLSPCIDNTIIRTLLILMAIDMGIVKIAEVFKLRFK